MWLLQQLFSNATRVTSSTGRELGVGTLKRKKANIGTGIFFTHKSWGIAGNSRKDFLYLSLDRYSSLCTNLQCTRIGPELGMLSCFWFIWSRKLRTPPGSLGTPWSGQLRYW